MVSKTDLVEAVAEKTGISKKASGAYVSAVLEAIGEGLVKDGKVALTGFGTFEVRQRAARQGVNPHTGEVIEIAPSKAVAFKAGKQLKEKVN